MKTTRETISVEEIAKRLNRGVELIQTALRNDQFPEFGKAILSGRDQWAYICSREAFENWMKHGRVNYVQEIHVGQENFETLAKTIIASGY